jgi:hypothetical protein
LAGQASISNIFFLLSHALDIPLENSSLISLSIAAKSPATHINLYEEK